ncbi:MULTISPECIES: hypothetical protein [unclassified Methanosarcina]|uniref:hypothetical protein n=1 Tax=unclassified Methanosarcina TaxID=2644672 RepID=UPI0026009A05|nr:MULTISPECIES: hypothetical protein [unclassified Methanosarcina]
MASAGFVDVLFFDLVNCRRRDACSPYKICLGYQFSIEKEVTFLRDDALLRKIRDCAYRGTFFESII